MAERDGHLLASSRLWFKPWLAPTAMTCVRMCSYRLEDHEFSSHFKLSVHFVFDELNNILVYHARLSMEETGN